MGFRKTNEGRVFFQGVDENQQDKPRENNPTANDRPFTTAYKSGGNEDMALPLTGAIKGSAQTQIQIITLLKSLNERLKNTQAERTKMAHELEAYRNLIEDLQAKSDRQERAYTALEQKITKGVSNKDTQHAEILARDALSEMEETRKLLSEMQTKTDNADKGVRVLKKLHSEQAEKVALSINHTAKLTQRIKNTEARQEEIDVRVNDTIGQQARLTRKIDKAIEERARFMRKIERIEETVLQTRDSLNAKAMVLLTDQGVAGHADIEGNYVRPQDARAQNLKAQTVKTQRDQTQTSSNGAIWPWLILGALMVIALLGLWALGSQQSLRSEQNQTVQATNAQTTPQVISQPEMSENEVLGNNEADMTAMSWSLEPQDAMISDDINSAANSEAEAEADFEAGADLEMDALAAALNAIEPGEVEENSAQEQDPTVIADAQNIEPVAQEARPVVTQENNPELAPAPTNVSTIKSNQSLQSIKPDSSLPTEIKKIETQAFAGVPEAQHDLAAIYTAGHGGVKQDYKRARVWFEQAAANGVANAAYNLGVLNHQGLGAKADMSQAIKWYTRAASLGHPEAQYNLGIAYIEGIGVPYNAQKAAAFFESAANSKIMEAAYNLGLIYENGLLGQPAPDQALAWYKNAADQGSPEAKEALEQLASSLKIPLDQVNAVAGDVTKSPQNIVPEATQSAIQTPKGSGANNSQQAIMAQVQAYLMNAGLYPGPADGINGPLTEDAIRTYQRRSNLEATGRASESLLSHMLANPL